LSKIFDFGALVEVSFLQSEKKFVSYLLVCTETASVGPDGQERQVHRLGQEVAAQVTKLVICFAVLW